MRQICIFAGTSHPALADAICERLGKHPDAVDLRKFSNGETSVAIQTSVRNQDVFIVQSGSNSINDSVMEMLIMINACKGGSAKSITAVMPYFPYSRQSKRKSHRGAIAARMVANLMHVAGVDHVITIDLHASQSQGFFKCPVDNLVAEPSLAKWIKANVKNWQDAVVVSKNAGGTKRVTSLADALKLSFGIVTTDRLRTVTGSSLENSVIFASPALNGLSHSRLYDRMVFDSSASASRGSLSYLDTHPGAQQQPSKRPATSDPTTNPGAINRARSHTWSRVQPTPRFGPKHASGTASPLAYSNHMPPPNHDTDFGTIPPPALDTFTTTSSSPGATIEKEQPNEEYDSELENGDKEYTDERARDVVTGRLVGGHLVEDDYPSPALSAMSQSMYGHFDPQVRRHSREDEPRDHMLASMVSLGSQLNDNERDGGLGGTADAAESDDEEEKALVDKESEATITLVGNVRGRPVFIVDDIIDKSGSWIAAAEAVVKKGGATEVYCMATHGLFGGNALQEMQDCKQINRIVVTNAFPIPQQKRASKLVELDVAGLLAEAIRRNHYGEATSQLYRHWD